MSLTLEQDAFTSKGGFSSKRFDHWSVYHVAVPVSPCREGEGPADILRGLVSHAVIPIVDNSNRVLGLYRDTGMMRSVDAAKMWQDGWRSNGVVPTLLEDTKVSDAKLAFSQHADALIPIVTASGEYSGFCASRQQVLSLLRGSIRPPRIGGMATPLGVHMTTGPITTGPGWKGLVVTGALFGGYAFLSNWLFIVLWSTFATVFPGLVGVEPNFLAQGQLLFMLTVLLLLIRLTPMAGLHAAEHMTINAIEQGLPLTPEMVRTQPRQQKRCGTNLMVLLMGIQLGWLSVHTLDPYLTELGSFLYALLWLVVVAFYWRPVGHWIQTHFTTKTPTDLELHSGLVAGRKLLEAYENEPHRKPSFLQRVWGSGMLQVLTAFLMCLWLLTTLNDWVFSSLL